MKIKIIKARFNWVHVYTRDDVNGKAEVEDYWFKAYLNALDVVAKFEQDVDSQYEIQSPSSTPSAR